MATFLRGHGCVERDTRTIAKHTADLKGCEDYCKKNLNCTAFIIYYNDKDERDRCHLMDSSDCTPFSGKSSHKLYKMNPTAAELEKEAKRYEIQISLAKQ